MDLYTVITSVDHASGGSGFGCSYYTNCPKRSNLDKKHPGLVDSRFPKFGTRVGTIFHAIMEWYWSTEPTEGYLELNDFTLDKEQQEALRCFRAYREKHHYGSFRVLGVEAPFPPKHVTSEHELNDFHEYMGGVSKFTTRLDMIIDLRDERDFERYCFVNPEIAHYLVPGIYIQDFKTSSRKKSNEQEVRQLEVQFNAYPMAWNYWNPETPCLGMIGDHVIRTKEIQLYKTFVPYPDEDRQQAVRTYLKNQEGRISRDEADLTKCAEYGTCGYWKLHLCAQH